jgi:hypothetical protein
MLRNIVRHVSSFLLLAGLTAAAIWGAYQSTMRDRQISTEAQINDPTNVGRALTNSATEAVITSRQSTVRVFSLDLRDGGLSSMTGTYITYKGKYFVLTAAHGIYGGCILTTIGIDDELYDCINITLLSRQWDYAVIQVEELPHRIPVRIGDQSPRRKEWVAELATQNTVFYTGYPNDGGPYTFDGRIVGYNENTAVYVDSFGWSGSSGAGVFSQTGNLIGWVMALEVGDSYFGRQVLENFM